MDMAQTVSQALFLFSWVAVGSHTFAETSCAPAAGILESSRVAADGRKGKAAAPSWEGGANPNLGAGEMESL